MLLKKRQRILRIKIKIGIIQPDNHPHGNLLRTHRIHNPAAEHPRPEQRRPKGIAHRVHNPPASECFILLRRNFNQFLHPQREQLRTSSPQAGLLNQLFSQLPVASFRNQQNASRHNFPRQEVRLRMPFLIQSLVCQPHTFGQLRFRIPEDFAGCKTVHHLYPHRSGCLAQPRRQPAQRANPVAPMSHLTEGQPHLFSRKHRRQDFDSPILSRQKEQIIPLNLPD